MQWLPFVFLKFSLNLCLFKLWYGIYAMVLNLCQYHSVAYTISSFLQFGGSNKSRTKQKLSDLFKKMSFTTEIDGMGEMKIDNNGDLRNIMRSARERSLSALTIS